MAAERERPCNPEDGSTRQQDLRRIAGQLLDRLDDATAQRERSPEDLKVLADALDRAFWVSVWADTYDTKVESASRSFD